jgi:uncharacterized damage-inducible protein DinB
VTGERSVPALAAPEREMLEGWLAYHRATLLSKCEGLDDDALRARSVPPSSLSLLGLVRHMTEVERAWFRRVLGGERAPYEYCDDANPDGDFDDVDDADTRADFATFQAEIAACDAIAARHGLDDIGRRRRDGRDYSLRWIYTHMIEEYARHNGHADLLRECIDGVTGD